MGEEIELLEYHAHFGPDLVEVGRGVGQDEAVDHDAAARRDLQQVDTAQDGGLAGPAWSDDDDHLALGHLEVHVDYGVDGAVERLGDVAQLDHGFSGHRSPCRSRVIRRSRTPSSSESPRVRHR